MSDTKLQSDSGTGPPPVPSPAEGPDLSGTVLADRYRISKKLGAGGMGTVYLGEHVTIGKKFALKVLSHEYIHRADLVQRFLQEARAASMISQQNVVEITDFGDTPDGSVFFVMEYLDGEDLGAMLEREGRLAWPRVRHLAVQICRALDAAHGAGIIHRDMKPDNVFCIARGGDPDFVKVLDFGIAKIQDADGSGKGLTQTGMIFGTPEYMSPEQAQGGKIDHRADIYGLGVIMYQLLCGRVPFVGETFMGILTKHMFETPKAPSEWAPEADIPEEVEAIVLKAIQKDASYRFQTMAELIAAIEAVGTGAAAVEVVREQIARPQGGPTSFARDTPKTAPDLQPQASGSDRRPLVWLGLGGALAAAAVFGYMMFGGQSQAELPPATGPADPTPAVVAEPAVEPAPIPAPLPDPIPAPEPSASVVTLHFSTDVPAQILDARDMAILGTTADEGGVELPLSTDATRLVLRAEGYDDLEVAVVPDRPEKRYEYTLTKTGKRKRPRGSESGAASETTGSTDADASKPDGSQPSGAPTLPSKGSHDGEIKNPFGR